MKTISHSRRGQVTIFIIVGIILVAAITMGIVLRKDIAQKIQVVKITQSAALQQEVGRVRPFVEDCLQSAAEDAILKIYSKGGYNAPKKTVSYDYYTIPVYFDKGKEAVPAMQDIANEIAFAIKANVPSCANFNAAGISAKALKRPEVDVSIGKKLISISMDWPIQVEAGEASATVSEFSTEVKADIFFPYENAMELYNQQKAIKVLSLIDLARLAKQNNFILHFDMAGNDAMVYLLTFNRTIIQRQPLVYTFGIIREKPKAGEGGSLLAGARASSGSSAA
ncbi:MAG: hypothetical protein QME12_02460 [Nanoarchaeota archaeon]|nr:hypothetical protein [Nanoarchaeota archaeon]